MNSEENNQDVTEEQKEPYDLYTEHIVADPWEKCKRLIKRGLFLLGMAVIFGLIAGLVMIIVYRTGNRMIDHNEADQTAYYAETETELEPDTANTVPATEPASPEESTTREDISLSVEEMTTPVPEEKPSADEVQSAEDDEKLLELEADYETLKQIVAKVNRSMVTVTVTTEGIDWFSMTYQNINEEYGLVIANQDAGCYIVTDYDLVKGMDEILVTFPSGKELSAVLLAGDETTGLAVILTARVDEGDAIAATLAGSGSIGQGDFVIAVGKIYGFAGSMGYGIATSTSNYVNDTDSTYQLLNTNIIGAQNSAGVLANLKGEIVGLITTAYNSDSSYMVTGYAMSGVKQLVENLSNSHETAYFGIKGQDVTPAIAETYDLPGGVYVAAVESNSPAYKAGLQSGDVITALDGTEISSMAEFTSIMSSHSVGDTMTVVISRKGRETYKDIEFSVALGVE